MSLKESNTLELVDRYNFLIEQYVELAVELGPKLIKFGKLKQELQAITVEFSERGVVLQDPESLVKLVEKEMKKDISENGEEKSDQI